MDRTKQAAKETHAELNRKAMEISLKINTDKTKAMLQNRKSEDYNVM